jgi:uncharacterized protein YjbJ (UPF0337 family)
MELKTAQQLLNLLIIPGGQKMAGQLDKAKGRVKEAAGALTGNERLKDSGRMDQAVGSVKQVAKKVETNVKNLVKGKKS